MKKIREIMTAVVDDLQKQYIPDVPGHFFAVAKQQMVTSEAEPSEAEGESLLYNKVNFYGTAEMWEGGEKETRDHGYVERIMPNGDKIFFTFVEPSGEEEIISGTGKFKNIKGKGRYQGKDLYEGMWQAQHDWEYEIAE